MPRRIKRNRDRKARQRRRGALAAGCAAGLLAPASAGAMTISEPPDFGDDFATRNIFTSDIRQAHGNIASDTDWFEFTGLAPGAMFSISVMGEGDIFFDAYDTAQTQLDGAQEGESLMGTVPADGRIVLGGYDEGGGDYTVTVDAPLPEPSSAALLGAGALGLAAAARRRRTSRDR